MGMRMGMGMVGMGWDGMGWEMNGQGEACNQLLSSRHAFCSSHIRLMTMVPVPDADECHRRYFFGSRVHVYMCTFRVSSTELDWNKSNL
jgi:hypothetical protein